MAAKKEVAKNKSTAKKTTNRRKTVTKASNKNTDNTQVIPENTLDEQVKEFNEELKDKIAKVVETTNDLAIENGDPSVLAPKEEMKAVSKENKITKKTNQYFGYFWNGLTMD